MIFLWAALVIFVAVMLAGLAASIVRVGALADQPMDEAKAAAKLRPTGNVTIIEDESASGRPKPSAQTAPTAPTQPHE